MTDEPIEDMTDEPIEDHTCKSCEATFQNERDLERHVDVIHTQTYGSKPGVRPRFKKGDRRHRS